MKYDMFPNTQCPSINRDNLHSIIKNFKEAFPDNFKKCGLDLCSQCEGSGLPLKPEQTGITFWQPGTYCEKCKGFGVIGITKIYDEYLCKKCGGEGCEHCESKGTVDWVTNAMKR